MAVKMQVSCAFKATQFLRIRLVAGIGSPLTPKTLVVLGDHPTV